MISTAYYIFWISLFLIVYTYLGYGILVWLLAKFRGRKAVSGDPADFPHVTMVIAAYNEADYIVDKLYNTLDLDYPRDQFDIIVVTDGSSDQTPELVKQFQDVRLYHRDERRGKIHAVNRVMKEVDTPVVVFSDANTMLNREALKKMVRHYEDPQVGGVSGEKRIVSKSSDNASGAGEGLYWKYESFLKKKDSDLYTMVGAAGELFSVRTALYEEAPANMIIEDFYISLRVVARGYRFVYEPEAMATETASASVEDEWKRKVRISAGGIQAILKLRYLMNPFRYGIVSFEYLSHRVLRWTLAPLALFTALLFNVVLALTLSPLYLVLMAGQGAFYGWAFIGYLFRNQAISIKGFFVPFYFTVMNLSVYAGFLRFLRGKQAVTWEKTQRAAMS